MIYDNKNWLLAGEYIDEGISGTLVNKREAFQKMIDDCSTGKIDLVLTKEISRFSRNTIDSIKYTELLLKYGTSVYFISDNINTIFEDSELRLTIMASLAQDEVRKISERVKFGINRMIEDRKIIGNRITGYYKKDGKLLINKNEAKMIRFLFNSYVSEKESFKTISDKLFSMGYCDSKGKKYSESSLIKMITNPKYKGYYTARLTKIESYKTHKRIKVDITNQIIEKSNFVPAIVSEKLWDKCNELYNKRKKLRISHIVNRENMLNSSKYTCKIFCKECLNYFIRCSGGKRKDNPAWTCKTYRKFGVNKCSSPIISERILDKLVTEILINSGIKYSGKDELIILIRKHLVKIDVEKINGSRKHLNVYVFLKFRNDPIIKEIFLN